jgi:hypothetical protein
VPDVATRRGSTALRDTAGEFASPFGATGVATFVVRPDGYLGFASSEPASSGVEAVTGYLRNTFG